jgi:HSP20 family protein
VPKNHSLQGELPMCLVLDNYLFTFSDQENAKDKQAYMPFSNSSNVSLYEDEQSVSVEVALPGLTKDEIKATFLKGELIVQGSPPKEENEDSLRVYHYKASRKYAYQLAIPGDIDETQELDAEFKNGVLKITFAKRKKAEAKYISIKGLD